ncbi:hypothetical protein GWI34_05375 [Actinomadura sp. DSM 109109]|nr:hypothetical protein [Actinomadura lepetitiana]
MPQRDQPWPVPDCDSPYVRLLAERLNALREPLNDGTASRLRALLAGTGLNGEELEGKISDLAEFDEALQFLWDEVQRTAPGESHGWNTILPGGGGDGPTHRWKCPVTGCSTDEPGLAWAPSTRTHCGKHDPPVELEPHPIAPGGAGA